MTRKVLIFSALLFSVFASCLPARADSCSKTSLEAVLGSTCTIGSLTFSFAGGYSGGTYVQDYTTGEYLSQLPLSLASIVFDPLLADGHAAGFQLSGLPSVTADINTVSES